MVDGTLVHIPHVPEGPTDDTKAHRATDGMSVMLKDHKLEEVAVSVTTPGFVFRP